MVTEKAKSLAILLLVLMSSITKAQDLYLGVKGGSHLASLLSDATSSVEAISFPGWNLALVAGYRQRNLPFGVTLEAGYIGKGAVFDGDSLDYTLDFFGGPILFDYYFNDRLKVSIGPEFAYLTSAQNQLNDSTEVDLTPIYSNRFEVGGTVGASFS